jgi:hypothetical protein
MNCVISVRFWFACLCVELVSLILQLESVPGMQVEHRNMCKVDEGIEHRVFRSSFDGPSF